MKAPTEISMGVIALLPNWWSGSIWRKHKIYSSIKLL